MLQNLKFYDGWVLSGDIVEVDIEKAKEIWKERIRFARAPLLRKLDVDYILALEKNDTQKLEEVIAKKQFLRDITKLPELLNATTIDEIKSVWPKELNEEVP